MARGVAAKAATNEARANTAGVSRAAASKPGAGKPAVKIPLFRPTIRRRQMHAVLECLVSEEIGPGALARRLTREAASALRLAGGVALADYGAALRAGLRAVTGGGGGSGRVLLPALAPLAYVQAAERLGLVPLLIDVDPESGAPSRAALQRLMAYRPQAAVAYHGVGQPDCAGALQELGLPLIEDVTELVLGLGAGGEGASAPAPGGGAAPNGRRRPEPLREGPAPAPEAEPAGSALPPAPGAGRAGRVVVIGLGAGGALAAGGGGLVLARARNDRRLLAAFPRDHGADELPDVNAALALAQWQERAGSSARCAALAARFRDAVARCRHRTLPGAAAAGHLFPVLVADGMREVRRYAARHQVDTRLAYDGCALTRVVAGDSGAAAAASAGDAVGAPAPAATAAPAADAPVAGANGAQPDNLQGAQELARRCLLFPLYPALTDAAANQVAKVLATLP